MGSAGGFVSGGAKAVALGRVGSLGVLLAVPRTGLIDGAVGFGRGWLGE